MQRDVWINAFNLHASDAHSFSINFTYCQDVTEYRGYKFVGIIDFHQATASGDHRGYGKQMQAIIMPINGATSR